METGNATHWVLIPIAPESRQLSGDPGAVIRGFMNKAVEELSKIGTIIDGPWFNRYHDGPLILADGRLFNGFGIIYYAAIEVNKRDSSGDPAKTEP